MILTVMLGCSTEADSNPADVPADPAAFCDALTPSVDAEAVGVSCVDDPAPGQTCEEIAVILVDKGEVDGLCASCEAAGQSCQRSPATTCTTPDGASLSVYSFWCGGA